MNHKTLLDIYQQPDAYDQVHGLASEDADFWVTLCARLKPASVLELGAGTGRLLLPLVRAGYPVTGIDIVPAMLQGAERRLAQEPEGVRSLATLVEADMRAFDLQLRFDLVFVGYNSVLHLLSDEDRRRFFAEAYRHTAPGGHLVVDVFNPDLSMLAAAQRGPTQGELEMAMEDPVTGRQVYRSASHRYDDASQTVVTRYVTEESGGGVPPASAEETVAYHMFYPAELHLLFERAGFEVGAAYGDYGCGPFRSGSPRIILLGRRAG